MTLCLYLSKILNNNNNNNNNKNFKLPFNFLNFICIKFQIRII